MFTGDGNEYGLSENTRISFVPLNYTLDIYNNQLQFGWGGAGAEASEVGQHGGDGEHGHHARLAGCAVDVRQSRRRDLPQACPNPSASAALILTSCLLGALHACKCCQLKGRSDQHWKCVRATLMQYRAVGGVNQCNCFVTWCCAERQGSRNVGLLAGGLSCLWRLC